jgi:hypothetical protein
MGGMGGGCLSGSSFQLQKSATQPFTSYTDRVRGAGAILTQLVEQICRHHLQQGGCQVQKSTPSSTSSTITTSAQPRVPSVRHPHTCLLSSAGMPHGGRPSGPRKAKPIEHTLACSLEDLYSGCTRKMKVRVLGALWPT